MNKPQNENYAAYVVEIKQIVTLENCDNVVSTPIFGTNVIVSKNTKVGEIGIYFPVETQLSESYLRNNNLYRESELNLDPTTRGYFERNGRIRAMKFRGNQSCGLFMPLKSIEFTGYTGLLQVGDVFDELNGLQICTKYIPKTPEKGPARTPKLTKSEKKQREKKIIENQFRFHEDTAHFARNLHQFNYDDIIVITKKMHGTSVVISNVLCNKKLTWYEKLLKRIGINIVDTEYSNIYSSRKVIKNPYIEDSGFYGTDVWKEANERVNLPAGISLYAEIVGFTKGGQAIQKKYDYGCNPCENETYVYRMTVTNIDGKVFEMPYLYMKEWCRLNGIKTVPELYYGPVMDFSTFLGFATSLDEFREKFLSVLQETYLEKDCDMCKNKVPDEGIVIRKEGLLLDAYKLKSFRFLEHETKELDMGIVSMEDGGEEES